MMANIFKGPMFFNVTTGDGVKEAVAFREQGDNVMTHHTILESPLKFSTAGSLDIFIQCVEQEIPAMLATQPFSGQNGPMTPYGIALLSFAEFLAGNGRGLRHQPRDQNHQRRLSHHVYPGNFPPVQNRQCDP